MATMKGLNFPLVTDCLETLFHKIPVIGVDAATGLQQADVGWVANITSEEKEAADELFSSVFSEETEGSDILFDSVFFTLAHQLRKCPRTRSEALFQHAQMLHVTVKQHFNIMH